MSKLKLKSTNISETKLSADAKEFIPDFAKSNMAVYGAVQDGIYENNEIAVATNLEDSIAKWSTATKLPTLRRLQELCRERKIKVSGKKKELKRRLGLASKHEPEMQTNDDIEGQAAVPSDTDEVQSPATFTQNQKPSLTKKRPLHSSIPVKTITNLIMRKTTCILSLSQVTP